MDRDLNFILEEKRTAIDAVTHWGPRLAVIALFVLVGYSKFNDDPNGTWVKLFERIGFGQWFRYLAGAMQMTGALLMLTRRTITLGAAMLACTMVGAVITDIGVVGQPIFAVIPFALLVGIVAIWFGATQR